MSRWTPIPIVGGAYQDDVRPWSEQDCLNYIPVIAERSGTRSQTMLRDAPGLDSHATGLASAPIRGLYDVEGRLLAVAGTTLYKVTAGVPTSLGTIPGVGRVTFAHNQVTGGNQVAIANGQSGYVYDTRDDTLVQITDSAFPGFKSVDFKDQYIIGVEPSGRYWFHSDLADALSYSDLDRAEAEVAPDRIQLAIVSGDDVVVLGERTGQFFFNTGDAEGTFENRVGVSMSVGAASPWCAARLDNTIYWLDQHGTVNKLNGYTPVRVSTSPIEQAIARCDIAQAFAFTFEDRGHKIFYLTLPDGQTWGYDVAMQEWHRRGSYDLDRWRLSALVKSGRTWIGGDYATGLLYALNWDTSHENGDPLERRRIGGIVHDDDNSLIFNGFRVTFNTGVDAISQLAITGDVPDGFVGEAASGAYVVTGGIAPYGPVTVASGTLPPELILDPDGSYSGTYTTAGSYSWTVGGVDALGAPFAIDDTAVVADANMWFMTVGTIPGTAFLGLSGGDSWSALPPPAGATPAYFLGNQIHLTNHGAYFYAYSADLGNTWGTPVTSWSSGGGRLAYLGGYVFVCRSGAAMQRRALPNGAWESQTGSVNSQAQDVVAHGNKLIALYSGRSQASISIDLGVTWGLGSGTLNPAGNYNAVPRIGSNGTRIIASYSNSVDDLTHIKYSDDDGDTWSAIVYSFPGADPAKHPVDVKWDGAGWIVLTSSGQIAYSPTGDAGSWLLSADIVANPMQITTSLNRAMIGCLGGLLFSTVDHGATWQQRIDPAGATNVAGITSILLPT